VVQLNKKQTSRMSFVSGKRLGFAIVPPPPALPRVFRVSCSPQPESGVDMPSMAAEWAGRLRKARLSKSRLLSPAGSR